MTAQTNELKPCPMCGSAASMSKEQGESLWSRDIVWFASISCDSCELTTASYCDDPDGKESIAAWNTRTPAQPDNAVTVDEIMAKVVLCSVAVRQEKVKASEMHKRHADIRTMIEQALAAKPEQASHPDTQAVYRCADAMADKMRESRIKGRSGWDNKEQCSAQYLSDLLRSHVEKGDPIDVANFAMMLHQRGERISAAHPVSEPVAHVWRQDLFFNLEKQVTLYRPSVSLAQVPLYLHPQPVSEPVATLRITHGGYGAVLSTHVAYALPEGTHDVYARPQTAIPDGWQIVPKVPTEEQRMAGKLAMIDGEPSVTIYSAMLAAAPTPPTGSNA